MRRGSWEGRFRPVPIVEDLILLYADGAKWPSPSNVIVVRDQEGIALIDSGFGTESSLNALAAALENISSRLHEVHTILCTHSHPDHIGGLASLCQGRRIIVPVGVKALLNDPALIAQAILPPAVRDLAPGLHDFDIDGHFRSDCGLTELPAYAEVDEIESGEVIMVGRYSWQAMAAPGHDVHMMCFLEPRLGILISSDLLVARGAALPWYSPDGGGTALYLSSLQKVTETCPVLGIPGHGGLLQGSGNLMDSITATMDCIQKREDHISEALGQGPVTFEMLERLVYPPSVHDAIPWASSVAATHLLEALASGRACVNEAGFFVAAAGYR